MKSGRNKAHEVNDYLIATLLAICVAVFAGLLRSTDLSGVDGADRSIGPYWTDEWHIHGNNHMLYPIHIEAFQRTGDLLLGPSKDAYEHFRRMGWLNAIFGGLCCGMLFLIARSLEISKASALYTPLLLFSSISFLINLTHPNEPMIGFFFSLLGIWMTIWAMRRKSSAWCAAAGLPLVYAMASYQSMATFIPLAVLMILSSTEPNKASDENSVIAFKPNQQRLLRICWLGLGGLLSTALIYGTAYMWIDSESLSQVIPRFLSLDGAGDKGVWGTFSIKGCILAVIGAVHNVVDLPFQGFKNTYLTNPERLLVWLVFALLYAGALAIAAFAVWTLRKQAVTMLIAWLSAIVFALMPVIYWSPFYAKLWIQPLALIILAAIWCIDRSPHAGIPKWFRRYGVLLTLVAITWNTTHVLLPNLRSGYAAVSAAQKVDQLLPADAVVITEWNQISGYLYRLFPADRTFFNVASMGVSWPQDLMQTHLNTLEVQAAQQSQPLFFLGLLHHTENVWKDFYGDSLKLDYAWLEPYRQRAHIAMDLSELLEHDPIFAVEAFAIYFE